MLRSGELHDVVTARLRRTGQRYTTTRRALVDALAGCDQPVTVHQLLERATSVPQSTAYRNLAVLERADTVHRVVTTDDFARYELAQDLTEHHHHLICTSCGDVEDFTLPRDFEATLETTLSGAARRARFGAQDHRLDVIGTCAACR